MKFTKGAKDATRVGAWQSAGSPRRRGEDEGEESSISISRLSVGGYNGLCEPGYNVAKNATDTERILWPHLRNRNFAGYKFRRQHPFGCYVLDFYSPTAKLAIIGPVKFVTGSVQTYLPIAESRCCGFGTIKFAAN